MQFHIIVSETFYTDRGRCELFTGYTMGRGLAVTGRTRDIEQNVLQSFQTGSSYCHILFLVAFLQDVYIRNIIIILRINYIIIKCNNNINDKKNNALNKNNLWKTPRPHFALQNYSGHDKVCHRSLRTIEVRALKKS
jgi:hypothetical protein